MYVVTGCSSGLGFEITKQLLGKKKKVLGFSRSLGKAVAFNGDENFEHVAGDLTSSANLDHLGNIIESDNEEVRLVLNAAQFEFEGTESLDIYKSKTIFDVNYFSAVTLVERCKENGLKRVLFVNSVAGLNPQEGQAQYSASKHALQAYAETLAKYSVGRDFDVMTVNPGGINSELWDKNNLLDKCITDNFLKSSVLAAFICNILELPPNTYIRSLVILPEHDI